MSHGRYVAFQLAEVAIPRQIFQEILRLIAELRPQPPPVHEAFYRHVFNSYRWEECAQMPAQMARSATQPPFEVPGLRQSSAPPSGLVRTRKKSNIPRRFGVHLENPDQL